MNNQVTHKPGPLRQSNKPHKGGHSKSNKNNKGKIDAKKISRSRKNDLKRKQRRHQANQVRKNKRDVMLEKKRGIGSPDPILVAIISLNGSTHASHLLENIKECDDDIGVSTTSLGHCQISFYRQKQRFTFFVPQFDNIHSVMDALKVADAALFVHSPDKYDDYTEMLLSVILAHSCPTTVHVLPGLNQLNPKKKAELKKEITKRIESRFPDEKLHHVDTKQELQLLLRHIGCQKQRAVGFRDARPSLLSEKVEFLPDEESAAGTLMVYGYIRRQTLNINNLVHIPGWGDFQMSRLVYLKDPYPLDKKKKQTVRDFDSDMLSDDLLQSDVPTLTLQESLDSEVIPDPMAAEQTWPTEEELQEATPTVSESRRVVKGTSEYQSAWIVDEEDSGESSSSEEDEEDADSMVTADESLNNDSESMQFENTVDNEQDLVENGDWNDYDRDINMDEEKKMLVRFREERLEQMFPDERDTPVDVVARTRYQKYRGLKNFARSPWDPMQNLPSEYARIFRFENFKLTRKRVMTSDRTGALPGLYVRIHIDKVPKSLYDEVRGSNSLIIYGLLPHEQKMSVVNVAIRKHPSCKEPIKSKDVLIFHIGGRRFVCQPIFSVHCAGNKFKYERFLPSGTATVASFFAPTMFPPASVVVMKQQSSGEHTLVATGSMLSVDPNRIVVKRVVLSGHPFKILKRTAVIRYMFFNKEDIKWFKSIELNTKCGRKGHIKEALGSHGHMKCVFDHQLQSQDVVLMFLYKRIFPKWTYDTTVPTPISPYEEYENMII